MLSKCCGCGCASGVPHALLVVGLLIETKKRWCPCAETVGVLEQSQWELLQTKRNKYTPCFYMSHNAYFPPHDMPAHFHRKSRSHHTFFHCYRTGQQLKMRNIKGQTLQWKFYEIITCTQTNCEKYYQSPKDAQYFYQPVLLLETQLLWLKASTGSRPCTSHKQHVKYSAKSEELWSPGSTEHYSCTHSCVQEV